MAKEFIGNVTAYIPPKGREEKGRSKLIGTAYKSETGQISFVIDTLPIPQSGWQGWCNIQTDSTKKPASKTADFGDGASSQPYDDDIPF